MSIRVDQIPNKNRPYWVWIWQGNLEGGGVFGARAGWVRYDQGHPGTFIDLRETAYVECIANCDPGNSEGGEPPVYRYRTEGYKPIKSSGRPPGITAFVPKGLPGQTGAITSFFPPIKVDIDCQQSPLRINGGQIPTLYDLTISANGFVRDVDTDNILIPFNVETTLTGPGPIAGYTMSQYTFDVGKRDLRAVVFYTDENNQLGDFSKDLRLSLSTLAGDNPNFTLEGANYYFDVKQVILENLVRTDGIDDQCGASACSIEYEVVLTTVADNTERVEPRNSTVSFPVGRIELLNAPNTQSNEVIAVSKDGLQTQSIFIASTYLGSPELIQRVILLDINCTYNINSQLPGCFIETPETCNVTIRDRSGIIFDQTYFGRPDIQVSSEAP